jgi:hypothetical protein
VVLRDPYPFLKAPPLKDKVGIHVQVIGSGKDKVYQRTDATTLLLSPHHMMLLPVLLSSELDHHEG